MLKKLALLFMLLTTVAVAQTTLHFPALETDNVFLGNNIFNGVNLFSGNNTLSGSNTFSGANSFTNANTFSGNNTHSGNNTFTGTNSFSGNDTHSGNLTLSGNNTLNGANSFGGLNTFSVLPVLNSSQPIGLQAANANAAVTTLSVLAFGAKADAQVGNGGNNFLLANLTNGNPVITVNTATFTSADVGKYLACTSWGSAPFASEPYVAQITAFNTTHTVTISPTPIATTTCILNYGTDNTPAFNACADAIQASNTGSGTCTIPAGKYFLATAPYSIITGASDNGSFGQSAGGTGATLSCTIDSSPPHGITSCSVSAVGSGYTNSSTLQTNITGGCASPQTYNSGTCGQAWVIVSTNSSGQVSGATVVYPGFGFASAPTVTVVPLGGDGATATATVSAGSINSTSVTSGGSGYKPSVSTLNWFGIGGTGCLPVSHANNGTTITAQGTATTNAAGAVTGLTVTNAGSSCSTPPTIIFGDFACANVQCVNVAPLNPIRMPVQIMARSRVSWRAMASNNDSAVSLYSVWDGKSVDSSQYIVYGGPTQSQDVTGIDFENYFMAILGSNGFAVGGNSGGINFAALTNLSFGSTGAIGMWSKTADLGSTFSDLHFNGRASWINGGQWNQRMDAANGAGGYYNAESIQNIITTGVPYNSVSAAIDDWFGSTFWGVQYHNTVFGAGETCKYPQTPSLRQTDLWIVANPGDNSSCYRGITGSGLISYSQGGGGGSYILNLTAKGINRYMFQGDLIASVLDTVSCENCTPITGTNDPYRTASTQEAGVVFTGGGGLKTIGWGGGGPVTQSLWNVASATGLPAVAWTNILCLACNAEPVYFAANYDPATPTFQTINISRPTIGFGGGKITNGAGGGIAFYGPDLTTLLVGMNPTNTTFSNQILVTGSISTSGAWISTRSDHDFFMSTQSVAGVGRFCDSGFANCGTYTPSTGTFAGKIFQSTIATGTAPFTVASTTTVPNLTVSNHPKIASCGGVTTCTNAFQVSARIYMDSVALSGGTATVGSISPAFTSTSTFNVQAHDLTTPANTVNCVPASSSSFTCTGTGTDNIAYLVIGW